MPTGEIQVNLWTMLMAAGVVLAAAGGVIHAVVKSYLGQLREDIKSTQDLDTKVASHTAEILDIARRLALVEGGIAAHMRGLDDRLNLLNISVVRLETAIRIKDTIRGLVGKRAEDQTGGGS